MADTPDKPDKNPEKQKVENKEIAKGENKEIEKLIKDTKEKPEKGEIKDTKEKPEKGEIKDTKEKIEHKEIAKGEIKDTKEIEKQIKELVKEIEKQVKIEVKELEKPLVEGNPKDIVEGGPVTNPSGPIEQRVSALEQSMAQVQHFITTGQRPDLSQGALSGEADQKKEP